MNLISILLMHFHTRLLEETPLLPLYFLILMMIILCRILQLENNLSETAFINVTENENIIRWFSPTKEVDLCARDLSSALFILII